MNGKRLVHLSGTGGVALIFASFAVAGSSPDARAPISKLVVFYSHHDTGQRIAGVLLSVGTLLFVIFSATIVSAFRRAGSESGGSTALCLAGAVLLAVGMTIFAGLTFAIGDVGGHLAGSALQALHVLNQELFFPLTVGMSAFLLGAGTAVVQTGMLPKWLGWPAVAFGIVAAIPSHVLGGVLDHIGFFAFAGLGVWALIASIQLVVRDDARTS